MQVSVENTGPLEKRLRVEVPEEKIAGEVQNRLQSLSRTTKIQGFRPGKAPFKVIQKRYGSRVRQEVISDVVQSTFYEALAKEKLRPASNPAINPEESAEEEGTGFTYTATFEIFPEVEVAPVEKLEIEKPVCEVTEDDVDRMIEIIRKQKRTQQAVDRPAKEGDIATIDFKGSIDGKPFEGGEASDFQLELGSNRFIPGFEKGLVGACAGEEKTLKVTFPKDYHHEDFAGKDAEFAVKVKAVNEQVLPELDEVLFQSMGVTEGGLEEFRNAVRKNMEREVEQSLQSRTKNAVLDALHKANQLDLPETPVKNEAENLRQQYQSSLQMRGLNPDDIPEQDPAIFNGEAEKRVALQLLISDIVKKNDIKADPSRVRGLIENAAAGYEDPGEVINWYYGDRKRLAEVEALALEDEVVKWVLDKAKVIEKPIKFDDLMNNRQTD
ncbi:MAG TPA: trigger factor [Gammaproteobacteria bacterium]|nr:trigger factor [Gammaproteobacteria bacterium]